MIAITIHPAVDRAGKYEARHEGRVLCLSTAPFVDAARVLVARGHDPDESMAMFRAGKSESDLTARLGYAAKIDIHEGRNGPRGEVATHACRQPV